MQGHHLSAILAFYQVDIYKPVPTRFETAIGKAVLSGNRNFSVRLNRLMPNILSSILFANLGFALKTLWSRDGFLNHRCPVSPHGFNQGGLLYVLIFDECPDIFNVIPKNCCIDFFQSCMIPFPSSNSNESKYINSVFKQNYSS